MLFFFQAEDGIRVLVRSRGLGEVYKRQADGMVIYCDPPYRDTTKYATGNFDYEKFYRWCKDMAKNNIVLISEYWMPDDGFECIWQGNLKCTLDKASRTDKVERLYICKGW